MGKVKSACIDLLLLLIITAPAFIRLLNNQYFSMHDDQHIVRLYLLDQGIKQGYLYPRWVDGLGFGFGYPLFNFYPPFIYYVAELFHLVGFSFIWSIKLMIIFCFYVGSLGVFLYVRKFADRYSGFLAATLYTYFFYHAVLVYVRGAFAELASLAILPFVFLAFLNLSGKINKYNLFFFAISLFLLVLAHPLIAVPAVIFLFFFFLYYLLQVKNKARFVVFTVSAAVLGLLLSAFFWLPSMLERKYTLVDRILTSELASYKLHFIDISQFFYSPWGYGGSGPGLSDGMTFQLGKVHIGLVVVSMVLALLYFLKQRKIDKTLFFYLLSLFFLFFSLFMTIRYSSFIWDRVQYLWYLQFPWRFLTFTAIFISIVGGYFFFFLSRLSDQDIQLRGLNIVTFFIIFLTIFLYQKYFRPERLITTTDNQRTSNEEVKWRVSSTSYEYVPKEVKTKKSALETTQLAIEKKDLRKELFTILEGKALVRILKDKFQNKEFYIRTEKPLLFQLNTYHFPGWTAYLNNNKIQVNDKNKLHLMTVSIPAGKYKLNFIFEDTPVRKVAHFLTFLGFVGCVIVLALQFKKINS